MRKAIVAGILLAFVSTANSADFQGNCDIRFMGDSTLHEVSGTGRCRPFTAALSTGKDGRSIVPVLEISTPVAEMDTKNGSRDRQMREMFEGEKYPFILAVLTDIDPEKVLGEMRKAPGGKTPVEFNLKIRNIERKIRAVIGNLKESPGHMSFDAEFPVSLKEYALKPPKVLFGAISVRDSVTVKIAFSLDQVQAK